MIDELGLSATVMHGTIGGARDSRLWTDSTCRAIISRPDIIGREPTILVISGSQFGNSDVWHATLRRSWEAQLIQLTTQLLASHRICPSTSHFYYLSLSLPLPRSPKTLEMVALTRVRLGRENSWFKSFEDVSTMIRVGSSRMSPGCHSTKRFYPAPRVVENIATTGRLAPLTSRKFVSASSSLAKLWRRLRNDRDDYYRDAGNSFRLEFEILKTRNVRCENPLKLYF